MDGGSVRGCGRVSNGKTSKVKLDIKRLVPTLLQSFSLALYAVDIFISYGVHPKEQDYYIIICCLLSVASKLWAKKRITFN